MVPTPSYLKAPRKSPRFRYRVTLMGQLILQISEYWTHRGGYIPWRDATIADVTDGIIVQLELRAPGPVATQCGAGNSEVVEHQHTARVDVTTIADLTPADWSLDGRQVRAHHLSPRLGEESVLRHGRERH